MQVQVYCCKLLICRCAEVRARIKFPAAPKRGGEKVKMSCLHIPGIAVKPRFATDKKVLQSTSKYFRRFSKLLKIH